MGLLSKVGPMTRSVRDAAAMLNVLARPDDRDPYALKAEDHDYLAGIDEGVQGWRIAYSPDLGYAKVDPEIATACAAAALHFADLGATGHGAGAIFPSPRDALRTLWSAGAAPLTSCCP